MFPFKFCLLQNPLHSSASFCNLQKDHPNYITLLFFPYTNVPKKNRSQIYNLWRKVSATLSQIYIFLLKYNWKQIWTSDLNCYIYFQSLELNQTSIESSIKNIKIQRLLIFTILLWKIKRFFSLNKFVL